MVPVGTTAVEVAVVPVGAAAAAVVEVAVTAEEAAVEAAVSPVFHEEINIIKNMVVKLVN